MKRIFYRVQDLFTLLAFVLAIKGLAGIGVAAAEARRRKTNYNY